MNYLFRPTPVVSLGRDHAKDRTWLSKPPAGVMSGDCNCKSSAPCRSRALQGDPWIVRSGSMAAFGTLGNEPAREHTRGVLLGWLGDDGGDDMDFSEAFSSPVLPTSSAPEIDPFATYGPTSIPIGDSSILAPPPAEPTLPGSIASSSFSSALQPIVTQAPPPAPGAGATGTGLPGTQPLTSPTTSLLNAIKNVVAPTNTGAIKPLTSTAYTTLPGYGVNPSPGIGSFLSQSTLIAGVPNATVLFGGVAAIILMGALLGGGKKR